MDTILTLTVTQLNHYIKNLLNADTNLQRIYVKGEISNLKIHSSGHVYLTLKDEGGLIRAVCFRSSFAKIKFRPENGLKIIAKGRIDLFERDGQYQFYISDMQPDGIGSLHLAYEQLKQQLMKEGLFDPSYKKPIPKIPSCIGIITAPTGAAVRDMINVITRRFPLAKIVLYPVLVQGESAPASIVQALRYFNEAEGADVLIVGRGGGSIEDLWAFNDEQVARAIFSSKIPVISAVGHETDFTISDFVCDLRAPTPSAAAELAVPDQKDIYAYLLSTDNRLKLSLKKKIESEKIRLHSLTDNKTYKQPLARFDERYVLLDFMQNKLTSSMTLVLQNKKNGYTKLAASLDALSPLKVLGRGFAILKTKEGNIVRIKENVKVGDEITAVLSDGELLCSIQDMKEVQR